ncbi:MAG: CsiV family protein [Pseudomonadota bacterium]
MMQVIKHVINFTISARYALKSRRKPFSTSPFKTLLLCAGLVGFSGSLHAEEIPRYTVEVIVFENYALRGWTEEHWPDEIQLPVTQGSTSLSTTGKSPLFIDNANKSLGSVAQKISKNYRILFHQAWSQNAVDSQNAPTVLIEKVQQGGTQMMGTIKLYKTRFAHIEVDLEFEKAIPAKVLEAFIENQRLASQSLPSHWRFNLNEARKIKEGELHYIDHPLFGVLIQLHRND